MDKLIVNLINKFIEGFLDQQGNSLFNLSNIVLFPEKEMSTMGFGGFEDIMKIFLNFGISLIVLKFLKKGFETYALGTDGDPDMEPIQLLTNFIRAMALALCFPILYSFFANIISDLTSKAISAIGLENVVKIDFNFILQLGKEVLFSVIFILVYFIVYIALFVKFIVLGWQIMILRIGVPLACVGLMDANQGVFRTYIQKFVQVGFTVLLQIILAKFSLALVLSSHLIWGFAALIMAIKTPRFLQEFLVLPEGNASSTIYASTRLAQMVKTFRS